MTAAIVAIVSAIITALLEMLVGASESSSKSEVKAANERVRSTIESYDAEKKITSAAEDAKNVKINPRDIFGSRI